MNKSEPEQATTGKFVTYWDPKLGQLLARVLEVHVGGECTLKVHRVAMEDYEVTAPFSVELKQGCWSFGHPWRRR